MVKTKQFSARVSYVMPTCKSVMLRARQTILSGSYDKDSGISLIGDVEDGGENDHSSNWGW